MRNEYEKESMTAEGQNSSKKPGMADGQNKSGDLEKVAFGIALMFGVYWLYAYFLQEKLDLPAGIEKLLGLASLYVVGLSLFVLMTKGIQGSLCECGSIQGNRHECGSIPGSPRERSKLPGSQLALCFLLQFSAIMIMSVLVNILGVFGVEVATTEVDAVSPYMLFMLLVFNPIAEEFVFRKLFADKLLKYGERFFVFVSAFCFAIVHGVSLGIPQVIYTFILGLIWGYVMAKTGDFKLVVVLHALSNLFGAVLLQLFLGIAMPLAGVYSILLMATGAVGLSIFMANRKKVVLDGEPGLVRVEVLKSLFTNKGIWFYVALTVVMMVVK